MNDIHTINDENDKEDDVNEASGIDNDSSLKDIYTGQTFKSFKVLEKCLKRYANQTGFEIRTVISEKEDGTWSRKTHKRIMGANMNIRKASGSDIFNQFVGDHNHALQSASALHCITQDTRQYHGRGTILCSKVSSGATVLKSVP
nr:10351_t:CDS:2 [Entrophospora candida]